MVSSHSASTSRFSMSFEKPIASARSSSAACVWPVQVLIWPRCSQPMAWPRRSSAAANRPSASSSHSTAPAASPACSRASESVDSVAAIIHRVAHRAAQRQAGRRAGAAPRRGRPRQPASAAAGVQHMAQRLATPAPPAWCSMALTASRPSRTWPRMIQKPAAPPPASPRRSGSPPGAAGAGRWPWPRAGCRARWTAGPPTGPARGPACRRAASLASVK
jgi:hypothetical protein